MRTVRLATALGLIAALAAALVLIVARGRGGGGSPPPTPAVAAATGTPASTSPTGSPVVVPTPKTTGRDFDRIWREITAFGQWIDEHSQPELVDLIYNPRCDCYKNLKDDLADMQSRGWRYQGGGFKIISLRVVEDFGDLVRLEVRDEQSPQSIVDRSGAVLKSSPGRHPANFSILLTLEDDGRWRVLSMTPFPDV